MKLTMICLAAQGAVFFAAATTHAGDPTPAAVNAPPSSALVPDTSAEAAAGLREHHRHHNSSGLTTFVAMSLDTLGTTDEAKHAQVGKLQAELLANMAPGRAAEGELLEMLAAGVSAGSVESAQADAAVTKLKAAAAARRDTEYDLLNRLHALLSKEERAALADKVEAHWEVWKEVNQSAPGDSKRESRLADLSDEVGLTPEQVTKMSAVLKKSGDPEVDKRDPKRGEAYLHAFTTGFVSDSFDAKTLASSTPSIAGQGSARMAHFYETVVPLLTPEQRQKLADELREHASYDPTASGK